MILTQDNIALLLAKYIETSKASTTKKNNRSTVHRFLISFENKELLDITAYDIELYLSNLKVSNNSKQAISIRIKGFINYLAKRELITEEKRIKLLTGIPEYQKISKTETQKRQVCLTFEEELKMLEAAKHSKRSSRSRDYVIILMLSTTGLRVGSLVALKIDDIDFSRNVIHVENSKSISNPNYDVPMTNQLRDALKIYIDYKRALGLNYWLFDGNEGKHMSTKRAYDIVVEIGNLAGVKKKTLRGKNVVTPHMFRYGAISIMANNGMSVEQIQAVTHQTEEIIKQYMSLDEKKTQKLVNKAFEGLI